MTEKLTQNDQELIKHILSMTNFAYLGMTPDELAKALISAFESINQV